MDKDVNGAPTCHEGAEEYDTFMVGNHRFFHYHYTAPGGELFSCIAPSLQECRQRRHAWAVKYLDKKHRERR